MLNLGSLKTLRLSGLLATSVLVLSTLRAQDAKIVADNLEYSREFYSGVHFSAIAESQPSFGYQHYPDNGPERIQCDDGTFARKQRGRPWFADYNNDRGLAKLRKRDNDGAIADFTRTIELDPKAVQIAYRNRALARNLKGDADAAIADYDRAIELDPKNADAYKNRGNIKKSKGDLDGAISDFTSAIGLNSNLAVAYKDRGQAKQAKGDTAGAKDDLKRAGELDPELTQQSIEP